MTICKSKLILKLFIGISLLILVLSFFALPAKAASKSARLYFLPASGTYEVGQNVSVRVSVDTEGQTINAVEDVITFANDTLKVTSFSKASTILNLWIRGPSYNNSTGEITFAGGILNSEFNGLGRIFIINFKTIAVGHAWVRFSPSAQVLANDGLGTNIFSSTGRAEFTVQKRSSPVPVPYTEPADAPLELEISSLTHPEQDKWYNKKDAVFTWRWQRGITDYSYFIDKKEKGIPNNIGDGLNTSISYRDIKDGVWYFNIKAKTSEGWGKVFRQKIQVDAAPPDNFRITSKEEFPTINASPTFYFKAEDDTSGIDYFNVKVDNGEWVSTDRTEYQLSAQVQGKHQLSVRVYDKAGNFADGFYSFETYPLSAPTVIYWTEEILFGEEFFVKGEAAPSSKVNIDIFSKKKRVLTLSTVSNADGVWSIEYGDILKKGEYRIVATQETAGGIVSLASPEYIFEVLINVFRIFGVIFPANALFWLFLFFMAIVAMLFVFIIFVHGPSFKKFKNLFLERRIFWLDCLGVRRIKRKKRK